MSDEMKRRTTRRRRQRPRRRKAATTVGSIIPGRVPLGFPQPAPKPDSRLPADSGVSPVSSPLVPRRRREGGVSLLSCHEPERVSKSDTKEEDFISASDSDGSAKELSESAIEEETDSNMAPLRSSSRMTSTGRQPIFNPPLRIQDDQREFCGLDELASSQPVPLTALSARQVSKNRGPKIWKPFVPDDFEEDEDGGMGSNIAGGVENRVHRSYISHDASFARQSVDVSPRRLASEPHSSNGQSVREQTRSKDARTQFQPNPLSRMAYPYPSVWYIEHQQQQLPSFNSPIPNDAPNPMTLGAESWVDSWLRASPSFQRSHGSSPSRAYGGENRYVASGMTYGYEPSFEAPYSFTPHPPVMQLPSHQHHHHQQREDESGLSHYTSTVKYPFPAPDFYSQVNVQVLTASTSSPVENDDKLHSATASRRCKSQSLVQKQGDSAAQAPTTPDRKHATPDASRRAVSEQSSQQVLDHCGGRSEAEEVVNRDLCNAVLARLEADQEAVRKAQEKACLSHAKSDVDRSPLLPKSRRAKPEHRESLSLSLQSVSSPLQSPAPDRDCNVTVQQDPPAGGTAGSATSQEKSSGAKDARKPKESMEASQNRRTAPLHPPGLSTPRTSEIPLLDLPTAARVEEANRWFHTDSRGEDPLRDQITAIAEGSGRISDSSPLQRSATQVKQTNLLLGHVIVNLYLYVSNERDVQEPGSYFAPFRPVPARYCEPTYGGRRSYFDQDPSATLWRYPRAVHHHGLASSVSARARARLLPG